MGGGRVPGCRAGKVLSPRNNPIGKPQKSILTPSLAPINAPLTYEKMTPATLLSPDRWHKADRPIFMSLNTPTRTDLFQQVQLDGFAAAARTKHRCTPEMFSFSREKHLKWLERIRKVINLDGPVKRRESARFPCPNPSRQERKDVPCRPPKRTEPIQAATPLSLNSGIANKGSVSPRPVTFENIPLDWPACSRYSTPWIKLVRTTADSAFASRR